MAELTKSSLTPAKVRSTITDYIYTQLMYDGSGVQTVDDVCQNAIDLAWETVQTKATKSSIDLSNLSDGDYAGIYTAFIYLTESEAQGIAQNEGMYWAKRKKALKILSDIWGASASDESVDNSNGSQNNTFIAANVTPLTYTAREDKLYNNGIFG